jgi:superfamily II DNA or RNA helicase
MPRTATLSFDRGTLILHPPPKGKAWVEFVTWDDRIEKFRLPASQYRQFLEAVRAEGTQVIDKAAQFSELALTVTNNREPFAHQREALETWKQAGRRGVVVLPTGAGKTYLAQLAMRDTPRSTLIVVPTLDLMHQWYAQLEATFQGSSVGLLGGGSKDDSAILVATYDSAAIYAERLGNRYGLLIFDECHHLPADFKRSIAEYSIAPYRLGLSATPDRADGKDADLDTLIGPRIYSKRPEDLAGGALAKHDIIQIKVDLSEDERTRYDACIAKRNAFLKDKKISLGTLKGWQYFVSQSARSSAGREAMLAHREARALAFGTQSKLRVLVDLLHKHASDRVLIFTDSNDTVYTISETLLIPAITHQTKVKERHDTLTFFREGIYPRLVTSKVLNEGVDVPDANVAIVLSGTSTTREYVQRLGRILRKREGKLALLYEVVASGTSEERVSERRRGKTSTSSSSQQRKTSDDNAGTHQGSLDLTPIAETDAISFEDL